MCHYCDYFTDEETGTPRGPLTYSWSLGHTGWGWRWPRCPLNPWKDLRALGYVRSSLLSPNHSQSPTNRPVESPRPVLFTLWTLVTWPHLIKVKSSSHFSSSVVQAARGSCFCFGSSSVSRLRKVCRTAPSTPLSSAFFSMCKNFLWVKNRARFINTRHLEVREGFSVCSPSLTTETKMSPF